MTTLFYWDLIAEYPVELDATDLPAALKEIRETGELTALDLAAERMEVMTWTSYALRHGGPDDLPFEGLTDEGRPLVVAVTTDVTAWPPSLFYRALPGRRAEYLADTLARARALAKDIANETGQPVVLLSTRGRGAPCRYRIESGPAADPADIPGLPAVEPGTAALYRLRVLAPDR